MTYTLQDRLAEATRVASPRVVGQVVAVLGLSVTVIGIPGRVGDLVEIGEGAAKVPAEVVAVNGERLACLPLGSLTGVGAGCPVHSTEAPMSIAVGPQLRGRVLDGLGQPMDGGPPLIGLSRVPVDNTAPDALSRKRVTEQLSLGVRALDTLIPCGRGQRMGIVAGSGVGKSSLLSMIIRGTDAELSVIGLVGERGREVREFIDNDLGPEGLARSVVVVATSDQPPLVRLRAGFVATRIAEYFRDQDKDVLLLMDSLTRTAMAQREVGLSAGEPPATRGYPPSVFALLPRLLERAGPGALGSITALYTVLVEGDDPNEPITDAARSILDGHIMLDRRLATSGHFPSIDVLESVSRVANTITSREQRADASTLRRMLAAHRDVRELIEIGAYVTGSNADADRARALWPQINDFLRQEMDETTPGPQAWAMLRQLVSG